MTSAVDPVEQLARQVSNNMDAIKVLERVVGTRYPTPESLISRTEHLEKKDIGSSYEAKVNRAVMIGMVALHTIEVGLLVLILVRLVNL